MRIKSQSGYSLLEIGIALIIVGIFTVSSITLISASNENYRRIEQRNLALLYAIKTIEALRLNGVGVSIDEVKTKASVENNMTITTTVEALPSKGGVYYGDKIQVITANVEYHVKGNQTGSISNLTLSTLKINN